MMSGSVEITQYDHKKVYNTISNDALEYTKASVIDLVAGGVGATVSVYVGQPLDTVKVKLQTFPSLYNGMTDCFMRTLRNDRLRGLYAGTCPALAANIAENSILFAAYGLCQKGVATASNVDNIENLSTLQNGVSGFFAAFFSSLVLCPTELVKCRLQAMNELYITNKAYTKNFSPWKLTGNIIRDEGVFGLYRGFQSTLLREMPGYFFFFGGYEISRILLTPKGKTKDEIGPLRTVASGGIAGICFWISVFPFDVIKSRVQVQNTKDSIVRFILRIYKSEGFYAFYNGLTPTLIRTVPATGGLFLAYEWTKKWLHSYL
ncbi:UNVERIFIED_CONTAM: hypothetical protein RMT77_000644 [Armadillidium vulgare]